MFFNTIGLRGKALKAAQSAAESQEGQVYRIMRSNGCQGFTTRDVAEYLGVEVQSAVRALCVLNDMGAVYKFDKVMGPKGMPVFLWRVLQ